MDAQVRAQFESMIPRREMGRPEEIAMSRDTAKAQAPADRIGQGATAGG